MQFKTATVTAHTNPASTFHIITLESDLPLDFHPGQHIMVKVADTRLNHYSIASAPNGHELQLIIDVKPGRIGSAYIQQLAVGDQIQFLGPLGVFKLQASDNSSEIVFLATGSGISTLKSMIEHLLFNLLETRPIKLYFGLRHPTDIFLHDYFQVLEKNHENFSFIPTLSRPDDNWSDRQGRITELFRQDYADGSSLSAYLCGGGEMITDAKQILSDIGTPEDRIYHEKFY